MSTPVTPEPPRLRLRAFALGTGVFLLFLALTVRLASYVHHHQLDELRLQLRQESQAIANRLDAGLAERVTLMRQAASYWLHSETVTREEFKGYALRLLSERPLFFNIAYSGPDFKLRWVEPEASTRNLIGLDHSRFPDRYPLMNPREIQDRVVIGAVYRLPAADQDGFSIIAPIFDRGEFQGILAGTVVIQDLIGNPISMLGSPNRHVRIREARGSSRLLYDQGMPLSQEAVHAADRIQRLDLEWIVEVWGTPEDKAFVYTPHKVIALAGVLTSLMMSIALATMWMGKRRLSQSETNLRRHAADLEQANRQSEEAIFQLESKHKQLESSNTQLESANTQLAETNVQLGTVNAELEAANAQLRQLNKELDDFSHVVSHDLKEPLRGIQAFAQFLLEDYHDKLDDMGRSYLENLMSSASRMQQLINSLMQLARVTKTRASARVVSMKVVLENAMQDLFYAIQEKNARIMVPPDPPEVWGDPTHLAIVVKNLLSNGLKYNRSPNPEIQVRWIDRGNFVEFQFQDNGIGMDPRFHKRIFELFERLVTQEEYEGTGAGLAITKKIIEQHGGQVGVKSTPGEGSTFWFTLPRPTPELIAQADVKSNPAIPLRRF